MDTMESKKQLASQTAERLKQLILDEHFGLGEPLKQTEIAEILGVSRTPVREALKLLEQEGLVTISATGRTTVAPVDPDYLQELYEIRCQLEMWLIELAIPLQTAADLEKAREINEKLAVCTPDEWSALNREFHHILCRPANKPHTLAMIDNLYNSYNVRLRKPIHDLRNVQRSLRDHKELLAACAARDVEAARDRIESHILLSSHALIERLRATQSRQT